MWMVILEVSGEDLSMLFLNFLNRSNPVALTMG
jgi:hypothetical protein